MIDVEQRSEDWFALRLGKFTCSMFAKLFMGKSTDGYNDALMKVAFARITGKSPDEDEYSNKWMDRGTELEPIAIKAYETMTFNKVKPSGFFVYSDWVGGSPDGVVGKGGLEVKCPKFNTHMNYLIDGTLPKTYKWQVHGQMLVANMEWVDFFSFHPDLEPLLIRVYRDAEIEKLWDCLKRV